MEPPDGALSRDGGWEMNGWCGTREVSGQVTGEPSVGLKHPAINLVDSNHLGIGTIMFSKKLPNSTIMK